jgi:lysyl-tRNA synthetase class 2
MVTNGEDLRGPQNQFRFEVTHNTIQLQELVSSSTLEEAGKVGVAGRLLAIRDQGGIIFGDLHDQSGSIQIVAEEGKTAELESFRKHNVGDWVGVTGRLGLSRRNEPSVFLDDWRTLAKTEIPFPDLHSGINNPEIKARQRYLDLAINSESIERFKKRSQIVSYIRKFLESQDFLEVETPILQTLHGGATAKPFTTYHNALNTELYLRIAPELYLKRLVVGGLTRVFEIGKNFRNEGMSPRHNPEFTMMEVYAAYWDASKQMELTENLVAGAAQEIHGTKVIINDGREIDLTPPWPRKTMDELITQVVGRNVSLDTPYEELARMCEDHGVKVESSYGPGKLLLELYEALIEKDLWGPIFVTDYPTEVSPLARDHRSRPGYTERFEGIVAGRELCNGFSELNNPRIQYERFRDQERASEHDDETMPMDHDYIRALQYGMPPTAGLGIGVDRLVMLLTNTQSIRDVILFPTLKADGYKTKY